MSQMQPDFAIKILLTTKVSPNTLGPKYGSPYYDQSFYNRARNLAVAALKNCKDCPKVDEVTKLQQEHTKLKNSADEWKRRALTAEKQLNEILKTKKQMDQLYSDMQKTLKIAEEDDCISKV